MHGLNALVDGFLWVDGDLAGEGSDVADGGHGHS